MIFRKNLLNHLMTRLLFYNNMCGIWALINSDNPIEFINRFWKLKHRGPDNSQLQTFDNIYVGFHRLAIMDTSFKSNQPYILHYDNKTIVFICNGEIYNFKELSECYNLNVGSSDCMVIPKLYMKLSLDKWVDLFKKEIKGEFAFMLFEFDSNNKLSKYYIGRDMIGIRPLYHYALGKCDIYSSEIKGIITNKDKQRRLSHSKPCGDEGELNEFEPGTIKMVSYNLFDTNTKFFNFQTIYGKQIQVYSQETVLSKIRESVVNSIKRRLVSDRPIAFLLSGGVDSSLVAAISMKLLGKPIKTFCCGIKGSTDMVYAKKVAKHIGSIHTEVYFTEEEGLALIDDVIYTTETWDTTTIRASVGQYIVSRYIALNTDCKVVLVGEGPDEVCSSYLFNHYAPSPEKLHLAAEEYVKKIHIYDGRRADRCISRWGMEARIPFLDPEFISTYWNIQPKDRDPKYNNNIEKYMLRKAFDSNLLPQEVLWRKKEAFSDGISSMDKSWYQVIQDYVKDKVDANQNESKEASYYKQIFNKHFGYIDDIIPHYWQPKWDKDGKEITSYVDPSARTLKIYL